MLPGARSRLLTRARLARILSTLSAAATIAFAIQGCTEVPVRREISEEEQKRIDDSLGREFAASLEERFVRHRDPDAEIYLRGLALKLMRGVPALRDSPAGVQILREPPGFAGGAERLHALGLPGMRLYLSLGFLREVEYENELAAALALQIAHVHERHLARNLQSAPLLQGSRSVLDEVFPVPEEGAASVPRTLGDRALFRFAEAEMSRSISVAVKMLYKAGYDPRGLVELWKKETAEAGTSLYTTAEVDRFIRQTYRAIARYTPLRNPVVRSASFLAFKKRISGT